MDKHQPYFVYLIPALMLFPVGVFSAMIGIFADQLIGAWSYSKKRELGIL